MAAVVEAAAVAAAEPAEDGELVRVVDVVVVVPAGAGGKEITWLPTVWVYRMGVDLVTVTFGTGIDLETGG